MNDAISDESIEATKTLRPRTWLFLVRRVSTLAAEFGHEPIPEYGRFLPRGRLA